LVYRKTTQKRRLRAVFALESIVTISYESFCVGDRVRIKGYDREFKVGGVAGVRRLPSPEVIIRVSVGFDGFGGSCQTTRDASEFEKVE